MGAQYSIPYGIVAALHRGQVTPDEFTEATICSAGIQTLLDRCTVHTAANYPGMGRIELTLDDGSIREAEVFESRKTIIEVDQDRLLAKFRGIATPLFGERAADQVISTIERLEDIADVRELVDALPLLPR
jgi:2-methylcitrate dehydratase PrpD